MANGEWKTRLAFPIRHSLLAIRLLSIVVVVLIRRLVPLRRCLADRSRDGRLARHGAVGSGGGSLCTGLGLGFGFGLLLISAQVQEGVGASTDTGGALLGPVSLSGGGAGEGSGCATGGELVVSARCSGRCMPQPVNATTSATIAQSWDGSFTAPSPY